MTTEWVDFQMVKQSISIEQVFAHYGLKFRYLAPSVLRGFCPLPTHKSRSSTSSFAANTDKDLWICQSASCVDARSGCKGGNIIHFVAIMEQCSIREAALKLQNWFSLVSIDVSPKKPLQSDRQVQQLQEEEPNKPLSFRLKSIVNSHPYISARRIGYSTANTFGIGYYGGDGSMSGRVVIPIYNDNGELIAYAGRAIDGSDPKYRFPRGFRKSHVLFNLHRALGRAKTLILVEGFFDCMNIHQAGFPNVAALMGCSMSDAQINLVLQNFDHLLLLLDGDVAGQAAASTIAGNLVSRVFVRSIELAAGGQPDQLSTEEIRQILNDSIHLS